MSDLEYNIKLFAYISHGFPPHQAISIKIRIWFSPNEKKKKEEVLCPNFFLVCYYIFGAVNMNYIAYCFDGFDVCMYIYLE